jgi:hypothetical protein
MNLKGTSLVGGSVNYCRVENDFYATDPKSVEDLLALESFTGESILEPCCGEGHISKVLNNKINCNIVSKDLIYRGYGEGGVDFIKEDFTNKKYTHVITNPPYKHAKEFIDKSLAITTNKVAMFLKIQFLEGQSRKEWFQKTPLKYVYVFSKRQVTLNNGNDINPKTKKKWANTMCFAWFVWEQGYKGCPMIKWI